MRNIFTAKGHSTAQSGGWATLLAMCLCLLYSAAGNAQTEAPATKMWVATSLQRIFPASPAAEQNDIQMPSARNATVSFQVAVRNESSKKLRVICDVDGAPDLNVRVRRVGYVPLPHRNTDIDLKVADGGDHLPGLVPDPLFPESGADVGPYENQSFWITVKVPAAVAPGMRTLSIHLNSETGKEKKHTPLGTMSAHVDVRPFVIKPRHDFPVTHWWSADGIYDYYKTEPFSETWWKETKLYLADMTAHGSNVIAVPMLQNRREVVARPAQLLKVTEVSPGKYSFDFSDVRRFIDMSKSVGMQYFEFPHLWLYWGVREPIHVYQKNGDKYELLWPTETAPTTGVYRNFLEQFLPALRKFLDEEQLPPDRTFFHVSDEPPGETLENYKRARALLKELAPWMKVMDALSDIQYGKQHITDMPVVILNSAQNYIDAGIPHWVYYCTGPRGDYLNRFYDTPLATIRMSGWLFYHLGAKGFLHWGYNYWYKMDTQQLEDTFKEGAGGAWPGIAYGDPFVVYPGPDGPIDSIRWEVFAESLQDYAMLQTAGIKPDSPMLSDLKSYKDFPRQQQWAEEKVKEILNGTK